MKLAIVGMGCMFPGASDTEAFWGTIKSGTDGIGPVPDTHWNPDDYFDSDPKRPDFTYARRGGFLRPITFHPMEFGISPNDLEATDTAQLLTLLCAREALQDAGYGPERDFDRSAVSVILGVTGTQELVIPLGARLGHPIWRRALQSEGLPDEQIERIVHAIGDGYVGWRESSFPGLLGNVVAGRVANRLNLHGTNCVVDAACASSLSALHLAALELDAGRCDVAVTGGADTFNDIFMYMCFSKTPALSPTGDAKPYAADGDGTILGEGIGLVVLKRLSDAERDGDQIYAVIRSVGTSSDGSGNAIYAPSAEGQARALRDAYRQALVTPDTIELVEGHGTGTRVGDAVEASALAQVYRESNSTRKRWCALGSVKSQIGHTKAAAGAAGLIKAALALKNKVLPPSIKVNQPLEVLTGEDSPLYVNATARPWLPRAEHPRRAALSSFGFGGSNFHIVLEEHQSTKQEPDWDGSVRLLALSGATPSEIARQLDSFDGDKNVAWESCQRFQSESACRLILVLTGDEEPILRAGHELLAKADAAPGIRFAGSPVGAYFGRGPTPGKLAFLFPGQGSQRVGMLRDLACQFPEMLDALNHANRINGGEPRLNDRIYPPHPFTTEERARLDADLRATDVAQPALGAVSLGAMAVLRRFGVVPEMAAGHSFGELLALHAAGCFGESDLLQIARERGRLMAEQATSSHHHDGGAMLAVHAGLEQVEACLREDGLDIQVANVNSPTQVVLSGPTAMIERGAETLSRRGLRTIRLPVSAAFHSPLVAGAAKPFESTLARIDWKVPQFPVIANTTARPYPHHPNEARRLLANQLAQRVDFVGVVRTLAEQGSRTFVEVGPGRVLAGLASQTLVGVPDAETISLDASGENGIRDCARTLAQLAARGHAVNLAAWERPRRAKLPGKGMAVTLCGANYRRRDETEPSPSPPPPMTGSRPALNSHVSEITTPTEPMAAEHPSLSPGLDLTRHALVALQQMQEQTARAHRLFLKQQESAQATLRDLLRPQAATASPVVPHVSPPVPVSAPVTHEPAPHVNGKTTVHTLPPVEPTSTPTPPPTPTPAPVTPSINFEAVLMEVVADKTGYPREMLEPDMALDTDLGIDSIKRVEILSALQERLPDAPAAKPEHLGSLQTLRQVIEFLQGHTTPTPSPTRVETSPHRPESPPPPPPAPSHDLARILMEVVADKTGYPAEMLEPDMTLDTDLGIDSIKRVEILSALQERLPDTPAAKPEHLGSLQTLRQVAEFLEGNLGKVQRSAVEPTGEPWSAVSGVDRLVLKAVPLRVDQQTVLVDGAIVIVCDESELVRHLVQILTRQGVHAESRRWSDTPTSEGLAGLVLIAPRHPRNDSLHPLALRWLQACSERTSLVATVTRLDGTFGLSGLDPSRDPSEGGLAGLTKTVGHEWPNCAAKAIDVDPSVPDGPELAAIIAEEMLLRGPVEVGVRSSGRTMLITEAAPVAAPERVRDRVSRDDVILITGGGRGVTFEAGLALAELAQPTLVLLGRTPPPEPEPEWLAPLTDEAAIKRALHAHLTGITPRQLQEEYQRIVAGRELSRNLERLRTAGSRVVYRAIDVADADTVRRGIKEIRTDFGRITGLIHGAGVLADRHIHDLTPEQFERVYRTKVTGLRHLLAEFPEPLRLMVLFSSITARVGRTGQLAYAMANEVLNKLAQQQARAWPECRVVSIGWGPWDGGMVTPALREVFRSEGVGLIEPREGGRFLCAELATPDRVVEVVALGHSGANDLVVSVESHFVLASHVIDGRAVVPLALQIEWMADAALRAHPGLSFLGCDDVRVLTGIRLAAGEAARVKFRVGPVSMTSDGIRLVPVELVRDGALAACARATMLLGSAYPSAPHAEPPPSVARYSRTLDAAYQEVLFHGPDLHAFRTVDALGRGGFVARTRPAPSPSEWMRTPIRPRWIAEPLALDAAFQLLILWGDHVYGSGTLPTGVAQYRQFRASFPTDGVRIVGRITSDNSLTARADVDFLDADARVVARLVGCECVIDRNLNAAFRRNTLAEPAEA